MKKNLFKKTFTMLTIAMTCMFAFTGCGSKDDVTIYTSMEDYRVEYLNKRLAEQFPDYNITVEYMSTGNHAAKLLAEGTSTDCDISFDLEYGYMEQLAEAGVLADLSSYDTSVYVPDIVLSKFYLPEVRNGGSIIVNTKTLADKGLAEPTSYADLLKPEYAGLISMPSPKSSGTGYMFLKSLVNAWGEDAAFEYFDQLTPNILQYTSSGSGPLNAVVQGEAAIGLGMTAPAVTQINNDQPLKLITFEEGAPYSMYGTGIIAGKEEDPKVKEVFDFLVNTFNYENCEQFFPEKIYADKDFSVENYPENITYADMSNDTIAEKDRLLSKWKY